jgi:hypothetical protein
MKHRHRQKRGQSEEAAQKDKVPKVDLLPLAIKIAGDREVAAPQRKAKLSKTHAKMRVKRSINE